MDLLHDTKEDDKGLVHLRRGASRRTGHQGTPEIDVDAMSIEPVAGLRKEWASAADVWFTSAGRQDILKP